MANGDYVPGSEKVFYPWAKNFVLKVLERIGMWNIPESEAEKLQNAFNDYEASYLLAGAPETRTPVTIQAKNRHKKTLTGLIRFFSQIYLRNPLVTEEDRRMLGLTVRDASPTTIPAPQSFPIGSVNSSVRQRHIITVTDSEEKRPRGGLPTHVHGFETWRKIGVDRPLTDDDFTYVTFSSTKSLTLDYALADMGKTVWYRFRWANNRNQHGPWSDSIPAIIA